MTERPEVSIDCPPEIARWQRAHLTKALACIEFVERGTSPTYRANSTFEDLRLDIVERLRRPEAFAANEIWQGRSQDELEHALACVAYLRAGLNYWQAKNLFWLQLTMYVAGTLNDIEDAERGQPLQTPQPPLPERDSSPVAYRRG